MSDRKKFDPTRPCLVVAPHLEYPVRSGADILIDRKYACFSEHVPFVDIVGMESIVRYEDGEPVRTTPYRNARVGKAAAAAATLGKRSHYLLEKFVTRDFVEAMRPRFADPDYGTVVFSFIWSADVLRRLPRADGRLYCVETHNDEFKWYEDIRKSSINPLAKLTAYSSERWALSFMDKYGSDFVFLHVSEEDRRGFSKRFPDHEGYVVPIGADVMPAGASYGEDPARSGKVRLTFVGALGVKINLDALNVFKARFFPILKEGLGENLEVLIVGSNPSKKVVELCEKMGWELRPDVTDEELRDLYGVSTFSILPFDYTTGSKLKLLNSLAHGVPYLATPALRDQAQKTIYPCLVSSDPREWLNRIREVRGRGIADEEKALLRDLAQEHSWRSVARRESELLSRRQQA